MNTSISLVSLALLLATALVVPLTGCRETRRRPRAIINGHEFRLELALDPDVQAVGLGGRASLPADAGMLFVFDRPRMQTFHMRDCYFDIDIAFIAADGTIINTATMTVEPDPARPIKQYRSQAPAQYVLETVGGALERIGAEPGQKVTLVGVN